MYVWKKTFGSSDFAASLQLLLVFPSPALPFRSSRAWNCFTRPSCCPCARLGRNQKEGRHRPTGHVKVDLASKVQGGQPICDVAHGLPACADGPQMDRVNPTRRSDSKHPSPNALPSPAPGRVERRPGHAVEALGFPRGASRRQKEVKEPVALLTQRCRMAKYSRTLALRCLRVFVG